MSYDAFDRYVDAHVEEYLERLRALLQIRSIAAEQTQAMGDAAGQVQELAARAGLAVERVSTGDGPDVILAQGGAGSRGLLVYNHYDVQPPEPLEEWICDPFAGEERAGVLYARGASDNKGTLVARLCAVEAYRAVFGELPLRACFVLEGEEEVGSPHLAGFAAGHADLLRSLDGCLWESGYTDEAGRPVVQLGLKGVESVDLRVRTASSDAHSGYGGLYPNAAWRLVEALTTLRSSDGVVQIDGLLERVRPPSASEEAALATIPFDGHALRDNLEMTGFLDGLDGVPALRRLMFEPTVTINGMWGGYMGAGSKTVIPARAFAKLDMRLVPDLTPGLALELLRAHLVSRGFGDIEVIEVEEGLMPARTDPAAPIVQTVLRTLRHVHGAEPVVWPTSPGSGPMYQLCIAYGIPVISTGVGWTESRPHAPNESIRVSDFVEGIKVFGRVLREFSSPVAREIL